MNGLAKNKPECSLASSVPMALQTLYRPVTYHIEQLLRERDKKAETQPASSAQLKIRISGTALMGDVEEQPSGRSSPRGRSRSASPAADRPSAVGWSGTAISLDESDPKRRSSKSDLKQQLARIRAELEAVKRDKQDNAALELLREQASRLVVLELYKLKNRIDESLESRDGGTGTAAHGAGTGGQLSSSDPFRPLGANTNYPPPTTSINSAATTVPLDVVTADASVSVTADATIDISPEEFESNSFLRLSKRQRELFLSLLLDRLKKHAGLEMKLPKLRVPGGVLQNSSTSAATTAGGNPDSADATMHHTMRTTALRPLLARALGPELVTTATQTILTKPVAPVAPPSGGPKGAAGAESGGVAEAPSDHPDAGNKFFRTNVVRGEVRSHVFSQSHLRPISSTPTHLSM